MFKYESLKKAAVPAAVVGGIGGLGVAAAIWGFPGETPAQTPLHASGAPEAAPFAQGTAPSLGAIAPSQENKTVKGTLDHETTFYKGPDTRADVVGLWPANGLRNVDIVCFALGQTVHMQANQIPAGNKTDSDKWYGVSEKVFNIRDVEWIPASMALVDQAGAVPPCSPDIASK